MNYKGCVHTTTVLKEIDFPRYNIKCSGEKVILPGIIHVVSSFLLHFILYRGNVDYVLDSVLCTVYTVCIALLKDCGPCFNI